MKKFAILSCILLIMSCAHVSDKPAETTPSYNADGWWTGEFQGVNVLFNFKSDGDVLTGAAYDVPGLPVVHIKGGKKDGDQISFWADPDIGQNKLRVDYKGDVKDYDIMFHYTTTVTDPQGNSQKSPMPMPLVVKRIGTGDETYDQIKEILRKKLEDEKMVRPVPSVPVDAPQAKPADPIDNILNAFKTYDVVALSEGSNHRCIPGHEFRLALLHDPRFPEMVNDIVVECGNALYQAIMDRYTSGEEVPYDELSQVWMKTTQTHGIWNTPIYYELFKAVRELNKTLPKDHQIRVLLGDPPVDRENQTDEEYMELAMQRDSYPAGVIEREVIAKSRHALVIYGGMHFLRKNVYFAISDKKAAEKRYGDSQMKTIVALLESKGIKVFSIWGSANDFAQSIQPDVSSWEIPSFVYLKDNMIGLSPFTTFYPHKVFLGYEDSEGKLRRENVGADPMRSGLMQDQFDALMTYGPTSSITFSK